MSEGSGFVRVDVYNIDRRVYCGELALTPAGKNFQIYSGPWRCETRGEVGLGTRQLTSNF